MKTKLLFILPILLFANTVLADFGQKVTSFNFPASRFAMHPTRNLLFATSSSLNSMMVIDTLSLTLLDTVFVGSNPQGITFSESGDHVYVALSGAMTIRELDTNTLEITRTFSLPKSAFDIKMGFDNYLYATPSVQWISGGIMKINALTGEYEGHFSNGVSIHSNGFLQVSPDRKRLFFANRGLSPATLARYNISGPTPVLDIRNPHGSLGSNGQDLAISNNGQWLTYAVGGGNVGYTIALLSSDNFEILGLFNTGPYPRKVHFSPDDKILYAVHTSSHIRCVGYRDLYAHRRNQYKCTGPRPVC